MQKKGLLQQLVPAAAGCEKNFFTLGGLVLVMSLHVFPFMLTMLKNAMLNIPSSLEEAGAVFGARMRKIFLPLLSGNYAIGALLVFVKTLSEYGTPSTLGRRIGFEVFTTEIHLIALYLVALLIVGGQENHDGVRALGLYQLAQLKTVAVWQVDVQQH